MSLDELPDNPRYCFCPVHDAETGVQQICIVVDGMDVTIGTSLIVLTADVALTVADKLNRPLGWTRESWTAFANARLRGASGGTGDGAPH